MSDESMMSIGEYVKRHYAESVVDRAEQEAEKPIRVGDWYFYDGEAMGGFGYLTATITQDEIAQDARRYAEAELKRKVERPSHYIEGRKYEPWDVIEDWDLGFLLGNVVKYVARAGRKENEFEDLVKARVYLTKAIDNLIEEET